MARLAGATRGEEVHVPWFMDVHDSLPEGSTATHVARAHQADLEIQGRHRVRYERYWLDVKAGKLFCLIEAPSPEAANRVHREAHGLVADQLYEVIGGPPEPSSRESSDRKGGSVSDHLVYVDRFQLREGALEAFKEYATEMSEFVEKNEPGVVSFNYFMDDDGINGTAVFVFSGAPDLDKHLELAGSRFQEGYQLLKGTEIELLGRPSEPAVQMAASFNASVKGKLAGFSR
jgi:hypothetical protein